MNKKKILILSPFTAYKNIKHAGGKVHYYYVSKLQYDFDITLVSIAKDYEFNDIKNNLINTKNNYILYKPNTNSTKNKIKHFFWERNPLDKYSGFIDYDSQIFFKKIIAYLHSINYYPDFILLDWTQTIFLAKQIRKLFPFSKLICIEQDVTYLKYQRFYINSQNFIKRKINQLKFNNIKAKELDSLKYSDQIITLNNKDTELLKSELINIPIKTIVPYFDKYINISRKNINSNILYFGAMSRPENYNSAIWFIENVLPHLPNNFRFIILGNNPDKKLLKFQNERIEVTGFVKDISPYLESSLCFAAPIVMGAGIKIKILEAMSAGIPVLTNNIGIEGIPVKNNIEYIHCNLPKDYIQEIINLFNDINKNLTLGINAKKFIQNTFNYDECSYI